MKLIPPNITPGPWIVGTPSTYATYNCDHVNAEQFSVCQVYGLPMHSSLEEVREMGEKYASGIANSRFIAAAPAMAEALADLCNEVEYVLEKLLPPGSYSMSHSLRNAVDALKAAGYTVEES